MKLIINEIEIDLNKKALQSLIEILKGDYPDDKGYITENTLEKFLEEKNFQIYSEQLEKEFEKFECSYNYFIGSPIDNTESDNGGVDLPRRIKINLDDNIEIESFSKVQFE